MSFGQALAAGFAGACTLTILHESVRQVVPQAPRMDVLGMRVLARPMRHLDYAPPPDDQLHTLALVGDIVSNSLYYSLIGLSKPTNVLRNGTLLGLAAGVGGVLLPGPLGLGDAPSTRTAATKAMTVGWYVAGGISAAVAYRWLAESSNASL